MEMMEELDYYRLYQEGEIDEEDLPEEIWCDMIYEEAEAYCALFKIDTHNITHDEIIDCGVRTAGALGFTESDVILQLEHYYNCFE